MSRLKTPITFHFRHGMKTHLWITVRCNDCNREQDWEHEPSPDEQVIKLRAGCSLCQESCRLTFSFGGHSYTLLVDDPRLFSSADILHTSKL